jgi:hypothetical protein
MRVRQIGTAAERDANISHMALSTVVFWAALQTARAAWADDSGPC